MEIVYFEHDFYVALVNFNASFPTTVYKEESHQRLEGILAKGGARTFFTFPIPVTSPVAFAPMMLT